MVDDFSGYKALFANGVTELGCVAHARRKFFDLNTAQANPIALEALNRIAALYVIEAHGRDMTVEARTQWRQAQAQPLLDSMHAWLRQIRVMVANGPRPPRGGGLAKAVDYSIKALGRLESVCHRWPFADRQQSGGPRPAPGEHHPADRDWSQELALYRI